MKSAATAVSYCGGGFLGAYHIGAYSALAVHTNTAELMKKCVIAGSSAGAIVGAAICAGVEIDAMRNALVRVADTVRRLPFGLFTPAKFGLPYGLVGEVRAELEAMLPHDAHERCTGRLHVGVTWVSNAHTGTSDHIGDSDAQTRGFGLVSNFSSRGTLVDAVIASSFIPAITGPLIGAPLPRVGGGIAIDGGLTRNWPAPPGARRTIYVSPIPGPDFDVCPMFNPKAPNFPAQPRPWDARCGAGDSVRVALDPTVLLPMLLQIFRAPSPAIIDGLIECGLQDAERFAASKAAANLEW